MHQESATWFPEGMDDGELTERLCHTVDAANGLRWWLVAGISGGLSLLLLVGLAQVFGQGVGLLGINIPVAWGFPIVNTILSLIHI